MLSTNVTKIVLSKFKDNTAKHTQFAKIVSTKESDLANLNSELEGLRNTYFAKKEMYSMTPQLATADDVNIAANAVRECESKIANKQAEIDECKATLSTIETTINALRSKL